MLLKKNRSYQKRKEKRVRKISLYQEFIKFELDSYTYIEI